MPIFAALSAALPAIISTGGGIANSVINSGNSADAASKALAAQQAASSAASGTIGRGAATTGALFSPYLNSGNAALSQLDALLGLGTPGQAPGVAAATNPQNTTPDWAAYVNNNPDILAAYNSYGKQQGTSLQDFGQWHWSNFGQAEAAANDPNRTFTPYGPASAQATSAPAASGGPGADAATLQQQAIDQLKGSPLFTSLFNTGQDAILANGAATGGLRGGNTQNSLARFGSDTLASVIQQQISNLSGIAGAGQNAAGTVGAAGTNAANQIAGLMTGQGNNTASASLLNGGINNQANNQLTTGFASLAGNPQIQQLLKSLGIGGTSTSPFSPTIAAGPTVNASGASPMALDTSLPSLAF